MQTKHYTTQRFPNPNLDTVTCVSVNKAVRYSVSFWNNLKFMEIFSHKLLLGTQGWMDPFMFRQYGAIIMDI